MQEGKLRNYLSLHLIVLVWGLTANLGKLITVGAIPIVFFRMLIAVLLIFGFILFFDRTKFDVSLKSLLNFVIGGTLISFHWLTFYHAIKVSNISITVVTLSSGTFFTSILEPIYFKKKIDYFEVFAGLLIIYCIYLMNFDSSDQFFTLDNTNFKGILYALVSALLSSVFSIFNAKLMKTNDPVNVAFYELLFGVICVAILISFMGGFEFSFFELSSSNWLYLFILGSLCTAWTFVASNKIMRHFSAYTVMLSINMEPIYAIVLALILFEESEKMSSQFYLGAVVIFLIIIAEAIVKKIRYKWLQKMK